MFRPFAWLKSLFSRHARREIFVYWDGTKQRGIDPLVAWRKIWSHPQIDLSSDLKVIANPVMTGNVRVYTDAEVCEAEDRIRQLTCEVFGVTQWTEAKPGLTCLEIDGLVDSFLVFIDGLKKKRRTSPTTSPPSAPKPSSSTDTAVVAPTTSPPDSGFTASESSGAGPSGS